MDINLVDDSPPKTHRTRMLWYFDAIMDWMIANPGVPLTECAKHIHRQPQTLYAIVNSDMFKAALAERKLRFQAHHDLGIIEKTTKIANASLDLILDHLEKKRDKVPLNTLSELSDSALQRLGYGVGSQPSPLVQNTVNTNTTVVVQATAEDIEVARMAIRQVQANTARLKPPSEGPLLESASEAESVASGEGEVLRAPDANAA